MKRKVVWLIAACGWSAGVILAAPATEYFVSPEGDDANPGTREAPWRTATHAGRQAKAGDTVSFLPGDYPDSLIPANSGTAERPIVFQAEQRRQARLKGRRVDLQGVSHIIMRGFYLGDLKPTGNRGGWMQIRNASCITVEDCQFIGAAAQANFIVLESTDIRVVDCDFARNQYGSDMWRVDQCRRVIFEGNSFCRALHTLGLPQDSEGIVFRGNVCHSGWSRNFESRLVTNILIENNLFVRAFNGGRSAGSMNQIWGRQGIINRFNQTYLSAGIPWSLTGTTKYPYHHDRTYHNVIHGSHGMGLVAGTHSPEFMDLILKNNIFDRNDPFASGTQLSLTGGDAESVRLISNAIFSGRPATPALILYGNTPKDLAAAQALNDGRMFMDNLEVDPRFADPERFDYSLSDTSPLRNAATHLTVTRSAGQGRELPVDDAWYFYDGYGIANERGDLIAVGTPANQARIQRVDTKAHILHLDRELKWESGEPVSFPWSGSKPDIGVFEHGEQGRASVQIVADRVRVQPGEPVTLRAVARGLTPPLSYEWSLGDGSKAQGPIVKHRYTEAHDYGVRVRVIDAHGERHMGVGYVNAEPPRSEEVLIHTTFDNEDSDWWVHWQFYRGRRSTGFSDYKHILDMKTGKGYHWIGPRDGNGPLPAFLHPREWNIDKYPIVRIRYRISAGAPIAIFVRPFPSAYHLLQDLDVRQDSRRYYFAGTNSVVKRGDIDEKTSRHRRGPLPDGPFEQILIDDGQWQEITFDVRDIRKKYPEVNVLQSLEIGDLEIDGGAKVEPGDEFWLDEIYIGQPN
ncbi:MAG: PKD domain-containing protein [Phycisphaerales bacterium]|nr:PKD domain-containing protein [Phycisphaerales bacterium]